jgi:hypothetical protein
MSTLNFGKERRGVTRVGAYRAKEIMSLNKKRKSKAATLASLHQQQTILLATINVAIKIHPLDAHQDPLANVMPQPDYSNEAYRDFVAHIGRRANVHSAPFTLEVKESPPVNGKWQCLDDEWSWQRRSKLLQEQIIPAMIQVFCFATSSSRKLTLQG